jgi:pantetheine-phosphate adenylyltransferase
VKKAIYAGSFDPLTNGHLWMIEEGARLFDELVVAIGINPDKKCTFSLEDRLDMLRKSTKTFPNIKIDFFKNKFLVNFAGSSNAQYVLRGIRTQADYEFERGMRHINSDLNPKIETLFLIPPRQISEISSSAVKSLVGPDGWENAIEGYVPRNVYNKFLVNFKGLQKRWDDMWERIGMGENREDDYNELVSLYGDSHRVYHNLVHVFHALREMQEAINLIESPGQVELAIWYHDAIYNPGKTDNEEKSAELARQRLGRSGLESSFVDDVVDLILATKHTGIPKTHDEKYIRDIDLSTLGKFEKEFNEYGSDIRDEYAHVSEEQFRYERSAILQRFLQQDSIYFTDFFKQKYEGQARRNLENSIGRLRV